MSLNIYSGITIEGGISIVVDNGTPVNSIPPVISKLSPNLRVGTTVTSTTGTWYGSYPTLGYYYQWVDNSSNISGATSNTYVIQSSDVGNYLSSKVIAYSTYGNSTPATSNTLGPVLPAIVDPTVGDFVYGGYYAGKYIGSVNGVSGSYYVIVAPASTEGQANYTTAYNTCEALTTNGYTDWVLPSGNVVGAGPEYDIYSIMKTASQTVTWPSSQAYYNIPTTARINYWANIGILSGPPSTTLVQTYIFYNNTGYDAVYANNTQISYRAVRFQTIPT